MFLQGRKLKEYYNKVNMNSSNLKRIINSDKDLDKMLVNLIFNAKDEIELEYSTYTLNILYSLDKLDEAIQSNRIKTNNDSYIPEVNSVFLKLQKILLKRENGEAVTVVDYIGDLLDENETYTVFKKQEFAKFLVDLKLLEIEENLHIQPYNVKLFFSELFSELLFILGELFKQELERFRNNEDAYFDKSSFSDMLFKIAEEIEKEVNSRITKENIATKNNA